MSRRVGIITFYYKNYNMGGMLQAYALQEAVSSYGFNAEQVCYDYSSSQSDPNIKVKLKNIFHDKGVLKGIIFCAEIVLRKCINRVFERNVLPKIEKRKQSYDNFAALIPHSSKTYNFSDICDTLSKYDIFICGSDQIWNDWGTKYEKNYEKVFSLQFVDDSKIKFSYAASTGQEAPNEDFLNKLAPGIKRLDAISVREQSSVPSISKISEKEVTTVVDPVMLLGEESWLELIQKQGARGYDFPYAFCYFLGPESKIKREVQKFCHKLGLKVVCLPYIQNKFNFTDLFWGDIKDYDAGPVEFINLIRNAQLVLTDSYHATVFSMIFHKSFYVFERASIVGGATMSSRITDFLKEYGLEAQLNDGKHLKSQNTISSVDYTYADNVLKKDKEKAEIYLKNSLAL